MHNQLSINLNVFATGFLCKKIKRAPRGERVRRWDFKSRFLAPASPSSGGLSCRKELQKDMQHPELLEAKHLCLCVPPHPNPCTVSLKLAPAGPGARPKRRTCVCYALVRVWAASTPPREASEPVAAVVSFQSERGPPSPWGSPKDGEHNLSLWLGNQPFDGAKRTVSRAGVVGAQGRTVRGEWRGQGLGQSLLLPLSPGGLQVCRKTGASTQGGFLARGQSQVAFLGPVVRAS